MKRPFLAALFSLVFVLSACSGLEEVARPSGFEPPILPFIVELPAEVNPDSPLAHSRSAFGLESTQQIIEELEARNATEPDRFDWTFLTNQERVDYQSQMEVIEAQASIFDQWGRANEGYISSATYLTGLLTQEVVVFYTDGSAFGEETPALFPSFEFRTVPWTRDDLQEAAEQWSADGLVDPTGVASPILNAGISSSGGLVVVMRYGTEWGSVTPLLGDEVRFVTEVRN